MKRKLLFIILLAIAVLAGCSKKEQTMTDFIPTQAPTEEAADTDASADDAEVTGEASADTKEDVSENDTNTEETAEGATDAAEVTPTLKPVHVGETTTKYVKLDGYDAILNVRATPSKDGEVVGFLVHTEKIGVIDITDGWASFVFNGAVCYVSSDFLVDTRPDYIDPPTLTPSPTPGAKTPTSTPKPNATTTDGNDAPPEI